VFASVRTVFVFMSFPLVNERSQVVPRMPSLGNIRFEGDARGFVEAH